MQKVASHARERAYEYLKTAILSGAFNPGERLTEERLARELGISRTPIREALHKLESEGLIKPLETRGFIASPDSKAEAEDLFELRAVLEAYALRLVCSRATDDYLACLEETIAQADAALRDRSLDAVFLWNTRFHDMLHELVADRQRLYELIVTMRKYVLRYRKNTLQHPDADRRTVDGHRRILLALRLKDPDLCERVMREHIREAERDALQFLFDKTEEE